MSAAMSDRALSALGCDIAEQAASPRLFRLSDSIRHNLSEYEVARAGTRPWTQAAVDAGLPWAWRLRVGRDVLTGGCPTRALCMACIRTHRAKLQRQQRGAVSLRYGHESAPASVDHS